MAHDGPKDVNTAWTDGCFALFVLADVSNQELDKVLSEAFEEHRDYYLWPAEDWASAPKRGPIVETATQPPVSAEWHSPFCGKTIKDCVAFMKTLPEERYIDYHHFCVLGEDFEKRKLITIYRIGDEILVGDELDSLPCSVAGTANFLLGLESRCWEEIKGRLC